jgi:hypothetical protein
MKETKKLYKTILVITASAVAVSLCLLLLWFSPLGTGSIDKFFYSGTGDTGPISGLTVYLKTDWATVDSKMTNGWGEVKFTPLAYGTYYLCWQYAGQNGTETVNVNGDITLKNHLTAPTSGLTASASLLSA